MDWQTRRARPGIEVREAPDGFVVYDPSRDRLDYLNQTAALLLESCNGRLPAVELAALLAAAFNLDAPPTGEVETCLATCWAKAWGSRCRPTEVQPLYGRGVVV